MSGGNITEQEFFGGTVHVTTQRRHWNPHWNGHDWGQTD